MNIEELHKQYVLRGEYHNPEYGRRDDLLDSFRSVYTKLSNAQEKELQGLLMDSNENTSKYLVADLLYHYDDFGNELMQCMLQTAVEFKDPSFNKVFLYPCIINDQEKTITWLRDKFRNGNRIERIGVSNLFYWLLKKPIDSTGLGEDIKQYSRNTNNLIELYHYRLAIGNLGFRWKRIPGGASALMKRIRGNKEYEKLLFEDLGWKRM